MTVKSRASFIPVDELMERVAVEDVPGHYGSDVEWTRQGSRAELRSACFLNCGKECETGPRALSIQTDHPAKQWRCFEKGCGKSGNLVSLMDLVKPGENAGGRPRGTRFKEIAADLQAMANGEAVKKTVSDDGPSSPADTAIDEHSVLVCNDCTKTNPLVAAYCYDCGNELVADNVQRQRIAIQNVVHVQATGQANVPLAESDNERARELVDLDDKFLRPSQIADMPKAASKYFRMRRWLTDEIAKRFRMGYLPRDAGGDNRGGTMRDKVTYFYLDEEGRPVTIFGRDPDFETKHARWVDAKKDREPQKFRFIKGFHKGQELYGQHLLRENRDAVRQRLAGLGLPIVAGPNDVMRLHALGVPSVALCSQDYAMSREQAEKVALLASDVSDGHVLAFLPSTPEGEQGIKQVMGYVGQLGAWVRPAWTRKMYNGTFGDRDVEGMTMEEWEHIETFLRTQKRDWAVQ